MTDKPPTRYTEEGISLPERGSGFTPDGTPVFDTKTREPEKLVIPAGAINWLVMKAFQTAEGDAWMRGFLTAHGEPSWIVNNQWGIHCQEAEIVKAERPTNGIVPAGPQPPQPR